ncbi:MAG: serine/threonine-protein kinase [Acidobacteriota bacterium]
MLDDLWWRIRSSDLFLALPDWLREPPGLWIAGAVVLLVVVRMVVWLVFGPSEAKLRKKRDKKSTPTARVDARDLRELKRAGNWQGVGELEERRGRFRQALAAYRKGGHADDEVALLLRLERRAEAKAAAQNAGLWRTVAEIARDDGAPAEAAVAYERSGDIFLAARCHDEAGEAMAAARCYVAAGAGADAVRRLADQPPSRDVAELLERAIRAGLEQAGASALSLEVAAAVRRAVQMWLQDGEAERAFRLAVDAGHDELAVWVARDHLPPSEETAELCVRAGAHLAASEIFEALGASRQAALERAEHHLGRDEHEQAAECFAAADAPILAAEQWAAAGQLERAAGLYEEAGDLEAAARAWSRAGDESRARAALARLPHRAESERESESVEFGEPELEVPSDGGRQASTAAESDTARGPSQDTHRDTRVEAIAPEGFGTRPAGSDADRYRLLEELGRGGMGIVYRAHDQLLQREVAYKVLPEDRLAVGISADALLAEARAAARLAHPNIVAVYDAGRRGRSFFVVMELVEGENFEVLLRSRKLAVRGVITLGRQICSALQHAHERRLVHRDLKPSNLLWSADKRVKLTDFGLARVFEGATAQIETQAAGTPSYMAPEQIRGQPVDPRTDLYAFGCVLYEMLCRRSVFGSGPPSFHGHLTSPPPDPRRLRAGVPEPLVTLILECLEKDPDLRPASAAELAARLDALREE